MKTVRDDSFYSKVMFPRSGAENITILSHTGFKCLKFMFVQNDLSIQCIGLNYVFIFLLKTESYT